MKKILIIFATAFLLIAQDTDTLPSDSTLQITDTTLLATQDTVDISVETIDTTDAEAVDTADVNDLVLNANAKDSIKVNKILFMGIQVGEIPELRNTLEDMIRTQLGREVNVEFIPKEVSLRICRKLFMERKILINSAFFDELEKYELQNTVVLLIDVSEYSIKKVRRFVFGAGVEGKLKADYLFYDAKDKKELFFAKASSTFTVKKEPIFWNTLDSKIIISTAEIQKINDYLLKDIVGQGFDMLEIAISLRK
jgi:hypothetical protein